MRDYKKYIENGNLNGATHLEVCVYYDKGGMSYFTGKTSPRGYYISVKPVTKSDGFVSFNIFSGYKQLLMETKRYSDKQFSFAIEKGCEIENEMIATVTEKNKVA